MESQKSLQPFRDCSEMTGANAARIARRLIELEYRGPGDLEGAMYRLEAKTGISYWSWWHWRHRHPPEGVLRDTWDRLTDWYKIACAVQKKRFEEELEEAQALAGNETHTSLVCAAITLAK